MEEEEILTRLSESVANLGINNVRKICKEALEAKISPYKIIREGIAKGAELVGKKYEEGEYFLSDLIMSGEVMKEGIKILEPYINYDEMKVAGKVVIGTVEGDVHDIGKNIVKTLLQASGFKVFDLGVDVPAEKFVEVVHEKKPDIVGVSALLTVTMSNIEKVIEELKRANLRDSVKVILGGAPVTEEYAAKVGADAAAKDAADGVNICKSWVSTKAN